MLPDIEALLAERGRLVRRLYEVNQLIGKAYDTPDCAICGRPISPERMAAQPRTLTCSPEHSQEHKRRLRVANSRRHRLNQAQQHGS